MSAPLTQTLMSSSCPSFTNPWQVRRKSVTDDRDERGWPILLAAADADGDQSRRTPTASYIPNSVAIHDGPSCVVVDSRALHKAPLQQSPNALTPTPLSPMTPMRDGNVQSERGRDPPNSSEDSTPTAKAAKIDQRLGRALEETSPQKVSDILHLSHRTSCAP